MLSKMLQEEPKNKLFYKKKLLVRQCKYILEIEL